MDIFLSKLLEGVRSQEFKLAMDVQGSSGLHDKVADICRHNLYIYIAAVRLEKKILDEIIEELIAAPDSPIETAVAMLSLAFSAMSLNSYSRDCIRSGTRSRSRKAA
jgi:hypothetical protein